MKLLTKILLCLIIILAFGLRVYQLDTNPPSLSWDEAAVGYNAYTIAHYGRDEFGQQFPIVFTSFKDDKHPVHIYAAALSVAVLGLSDFSVRLPAAIFGVFNCGLLFFLARRLFKSDLIVLFSGLFLAISPYNLQYSRGAWEGNFALFFFMAGMLAFLTAVNNPRKSWLLIVSFLSFGIDLFTYHSAKVLVPPMILLLTALYFKRLISLKWNFYLSVVVFIFFIGVLFLNPRLLGLARAAQAGIPKDQIEATQTFKNTHNYYLSYGQVVWNNYLTHFNLNYLFVSGDKNPRQSIQTVGEFYKIDALLFILGLIALAIRFRNRPAMILISWILLAPIPAALTQEVPHSHRALFMMGSMNLLAAAGAGSAVEWLKGKWIKLAALAVVLIALAVSLRIYLNDYYMVYPKKYAIEWQYGMKQIVEYVKAHPQYGRVYMTDERHQPYIFFLYYLREPLKTYTDTVVFNEGISDSYNLVTSFDKYHFGDWDPIESAPNPGVLYVVTPSQYDGLRYKAVLEVKDLVKYPNGEPAFYLVSVN